MPHADSEATGEELFLAHRDDVKQIVTFECLYHHLRQSDAEDFESLVFIKLIEDDYAVIRDWRRQCTLRSFLQLVIRNCLKDYLDSLWGKWRPSEAAKRLGPVAIVLDQLTSRDGYTFDEACELLQTNHRVTESREELRRLFDALPVRFRRRFEPDDNLIDVPSTDPPADHRLIDDERELSLKKLREALREIIKGLPAQDGLIVMLRFWDNQSIADIARLLRVPSKPLYPRVKALLKTLRTELEARGFDGGSVPEL